MYAYICKCTKCKFSKFLDISFFKISLLTLISVEPLPVRDLRTVIDEKTGMVEVSWHPENSSTQDSYKLQYHEVETTIGGDSNMLTTDKTKASTLSYFYFNKCTIR